MSDKFQMHETLRKRIEKKEANEEEIKLSSHNKTLDKKKSNKFLLLLKLIFILITIIYVIIPLTFYLCPAIRRHVIFLHYVSLSGRKNLSLPEEIGIPCTKNFYIPSSNNVKLGVWHVYPQKYLPDCQEIDSLKEFNDNEPIFLYLHGNAGTRAGGHRIELYKILREKLNAHVITFDYRGYGDSTNEPPSETGIIDDAKNVFDWIKQHVPSSRIYVWGHSLGTAVGVALVGQYSSVEIHPAALILEAPFTRIMDAARYHPLSFFHRYMPFFDFFIANPISQGDMTFDSLSRINQVKCPLLILHAEDDGFVPFQQGKELYNQALASRLHMHRHATQFIGFDGKLDFGHKHIYKNPALPNIIKQFIKNIQSIPIK